MFYLIYQKEQQRQASGEGDEDAAPVKPQLPLRQELANASHTFEKYKSKISSFFINSKKLENLTKKMSTTAELSGLNKLVPDYDDDEEEQENNNEHDEKSSSNNLNTENEKSNYMVGYAMKSTNQLK